MWPRSCAPTGKPSPEAIIADYRYGFIRGVLRSGAVRRESAKDRLELSDKLDKVLTNTLFGPLIMLGVLYAMFQLTFVIGAYPQGWVEDGFGWLPQVAHRQRRHRRPRRRHELRAAYHHHVYAGRDS